MRFEYFLGRGGVGWYWRLVARNGKTVADGAEGYASEDGVVRALKRLRRSLALSVWPRIVEAEER